MANTPRKMQDPTEAALSAIQDALNLRDMAPEQVTPAAPAVAEPIDLPREPRRRTRNHPPVDEQFMFPEPAPPDATALGDDQLVPRPAANDDRQPVGQVLQTFQRRSSRGPYMVAGGFAAVWILCGIGLGAAYFGGELRQGGGLGTVGLQLFQLVAAIIVPVVFFFVFAYLLQRAQELRVIARSMTDAAVRFGEPESIASESIVTVGQAIRREVAAMGDGVERALARAAELEALVHNEVAALERAYNDNELRIRGLIEDLASQRDALVGQAEQVRNAITEIGRAHV